MAFDPSALDAFFRSLPRTIEEARLLASRHDERLAGRAYLAQAADHPIRYTVEVRHPSIHDPRFVALFSASSSRPLRRRQRRSLPDFEDVTADFVHVRLHRDEKLYGSGYGRRPLESWAERIEAWRGGSESVSAKRASSVAARPRKTGRDVYPYFDDVEWRSHLTRGRSAR